MLRYPVYQLRRSFSLDLINDDSATVFLHDDNSSNSSALSKVSPYPIGTTVAYNNANMTTAIHWPVDDIDDALAADLDGSLSGLGMELNTSSFNMNDALMALPSLKTELNQNSAHHHHPHASHSLHHHHYLFHHSSCSSNNNNNNNSNNNNSVSNVSKSRKNEENESRNISGGGYDSDDNARHSPLACREVINQKVNIDDSNSSGLISNHLLSDDRPIAVVHGKKNRLASCHDEEIVSSAIKRFCQEREANGETSLHRFLLSPQRDNNEGNCTHEACANEYRCLQRHSNSVPDLRSTTSAAATNGNNQVLSTGSSPSSFSAPTTVLTQILSSQTHCPSSSSAQEQRSPLTKSSNEFQYVLGAATSMATKSHEETMTYLNQGQSYEIKLKKLGDLSEMRGKMLKSTIRVGFHERRLQFMEKDLIQQWKQQRQSDRILEIDIPLSYGVFDIVHDFVDINRCEFLWDPTKETGLFVKLNCISTEFTPKKHGGEKGVPFRLIIETSTFNPSNKNASVCLHAASCQVKVFKPKGADRKHKTDREKMAKRPKAEQDKYQPSYDCTVFTEYLLDSLYWSSGGQASLESPIHKVNQATCLPIITSSSSSPSIRSPLRAGREKVEETGPVNTFRVISRNRSTPEQDSGDDTSEEIPVNATLSSDSKASDTVLWLKQNRFDEYVRTFANFSGTDLLRLNRDDLIQICGLTDGIRLYNALNLKGIRPRLTLFLSSPNEQLFHAVYMQTYSVSELKARLSQTIVGDIKINRICLNGPAEIKVLVTDEVVRNLNDESMFYIKLEPDTGSGYNAILNPLK